MDSGVYASLHVNFDHHIVYAKFSLEICYPLPCKRVLWHLSSFNWERSFANKDVCEMVNIFNETKSNVLNNYITHYTIICVY